VCSRVRAWRGWDVRAARGADRGIGAAHGVNRDARTTRGACGDTGAMRGMDIGAARAMATSSEVSATGGVG
jgi:hypothetical protein